MLTCANARAEIGPASVMVGNLVSGKRIAQASGRDLGQTDDNDQVRLYAMKREDRQDSFQPLFFNKQYKYVVL